MREFVLNRLAEKKKQEEDFLSEYWDNVYASFTQNNILVTKHVSEIVFGDLGDEDLCKLFEYIIIQAKIISNRRFDKAFENYGSGEISVGLFK